MWHDRWLQLGVIGADLPGLFHPGSGGGAGGDRSRDADRSAGPGHAPAARGLHRARGVPVRTALEEKAMKLRSLSAGVAALAGAVLSSLCCLLPLTVIALGLGSGAFMAVTMQYRG